MISLQLVGFVTAILLCIIGISGMLFIDNIVKKIIALVLIFDAVNLALVAVAYRAGGIVPIILPGMSIEEFLSRATLVFPEGIVLTNIVIGVSTTSILLALTIRLYSKHQTLKSSKMLLDVD